jgi:HSP20 family protein
MKPATALAPLEKLQNFSRMHEPFFFESPFNRLFDWSKFNLMAPFAEEFPLTRWTPPCDVYETAKEVIIRAELPGLKKEQVNVNVENNLLTVFGERKFEEETRRENYHRIEFAYGEFRRSFTLPQFVESAKITAEFREGILTLKLPKREEAKPKQIEVTAK